MNIPAPAGLDYLPFQKVGIFAALSRFGFQVQTGGLTVPLFSGNTAAVGGVLIADEMGL